MTRTYRGLLGALVAALVLSAAGPASASLDLCRKGIQKAGAKLEKLLTAEQQGKWKAMTGAPFDTSTIRFGGRRGGGQ